MKINYNVTGAERKSLVAAISQELNAPAKYLGMPSAAYEVGEYTVTKTGELIGEDNRELVSDLNGLHSFAAVSEEYDAPLSETEEISVFENLNLTEREELGLGRERRDPIGEDGMQSSDVPETDSFIVDLPIGTLNSAQLENLEKLIASKAGLIKRAVGAYDLSVIQTEDGKLRFAWFPYTEDADEVNAYSTLVLQLCKAAKEQKRVTAKEKPVDNEKFAFRVFLIKLGFVGDEYKTDRKILLRNLTGNAAFKNGAPPKKEETADE